MSESEAAPVHKPTSGEVLDGYFIENRSKILDLAAFMDRFDRSGSGGPRASDHRWRAVVAAIALLGDGKPDRARRILELWSDPSLEPVDRAGMKGATGAWPGSPDS